MKTLLREYRENEDLSQGSLADRVGVTRQTINAIERNRYDPSLDLAFKLAYFFGVSVHDLFIWEAHDEVSLSSVDDSPSNVSSNSQARRIVGLLSVVPASMDADRLDRLERQVERIIRDGDRKSPSDDVD